MVGRMLKGRMQFQGRKIAWVFERSRTNTARVGRVLMELEILNKPVGLQPKFDCVWMELVEARFVQETE